MFGFGFQKTKVPRLCLPDP